uniref:G-patch domain-containing protein n=1 Tax=Steinernema glaseri TaxID=37863 RepID=A0A1I7ZZJ4_9BILA
MSILAAPRRKQKISVDPQNVAWKNDNEKFGKKLMEKMGWTEGKGLGSKEQGMSDNLKLKANHTAKGLGCDQDYDSTWISHHDDFASLLANLNKNKPASTEKSGSDEEKTTKSLEETSKKSKSRIHYHKFTRGKDLSRFSSNDKAAVIGMGARRKRKHSPEPEPDVEDGEEPKKKSKKENQEEKPDVEASSGFAEKTQISQVSVADYFAEKMRKIKEKQAARAAGQVVPEAVPEEEKAPEAVPEEEEAREETEEERKLRKQKRKEEKRRLKEEARRQSEAEAQAENVEAAPVEEKVVEETAEERKRRKREKKLRKLAESQENEA